MPKVKTLQSNFSAGELSPRGYGRVDIARYPNAAKKLVNVISRTLGGADKRFGTQYIAPTKSSTKRARLVPYIVNRDTAYMLEMGDNYMRVFKPDGTQVTGPYEITTPYTEDYVKEIDFSQSEDAMFIFHSAVYPYRLRTFGESKWDCSLAPFTTTPFSEQGAYYAVALTLSAATIGTGVVATAASAVFLASDVDRAILWNAGIFVITAFTDATHVTGEIKAAFDSVTVPSGVWNLDSSPQATLTPGAKSPVGASTGLTLSANGWRASDVGKFIRINSGLIKITAYTSGTAATGEIINELTAVTAAPALSWTLESSAWNSVNGYPRTGTMHEQRLIAAGTTKNPQTIFGSKIGEPLDFTIGTNDDDAFSFTMAGNNNQVNPISFVVSSRSLLILTYGGEYSMIGSGNDEAIKPTSVKITPQSPHGARTVRPVQVGKETLFAQRSGKKVRAMGYRYDEDGYKAPDITTLADHITATGIAGLAFQQEPDPVIWIWLKNGKLISVTLDRDLDIIAWNEHEIDGGVESVAVMPAGDTEQVWLIIRRKLGDGSVVRYVERFKEDWFPIYGTTTPDLDAIPPEDEPYSWGFQLDCAATQDDATGKSLWSGLGHLEGRVVRCLADGVDMGEFTVTSGQITLPRDAKRVLIGLMFKPRVEMLTPEIQTGTGSSQADAMSTNELVIRVDNTIGATVNGSQFIPGRINGPNQLDRAPQLFSGIKSDTLIGWAKGESEIVISQDAPFPFHLLAVVRSLTVNGG